MTKHKRWKVWRGSYWYWILKIRSCSAHLALGFRHSILPRPDRPTYIVLARTPCLVSSPDGATSEKHPFSLPDMKLCATHSLAHGPTHSFEESRTHSLTNVSTRSRMRLRTHEFAQASANEQIFFGNIQGYICCRIENRHEGKSY